MACIDPEDVGDLRKREAEGLGEGKGVLHLRAGRTDRDRFPSHHHTGAEKDGEDQKRQKQLEDPPEAVHRCYFVRSRTGRPGRCEASAEPPLREVLRNLREVKERGQRDEALVGKDHEEKAEAGAQVGTRAAALHVIEKAPEGQQRKQQGEGLEESEHLCDLVGREVRLQVEHTGQQTDDLSDPHALRHPREAAQATAEEIDHPGDRDVQEHVEAGIPVHVRADQAKLEVAHRPVERAEVSLRHLRKGEGPEILAAIEGPEVEVVTVKCPYAEVPVDKQPEQKEQDECHSCHKNMFTVLGLADMHHTPSYRSASAHPSPVPSAASGTLPVPLSPDCDFRCFASSPLRHAHGRP